MHRCLELAVKGRGSVAPNPMVGCVIVHDGQIIGEGWHRQFGKAHAEVNAITDVKKKDLLPSSTLYVNLEPCAHYGKTPPCADLLISSSIPRVVIGCEDSFSLVKGKGIEKMRQAGIEVIKGVLEKEARYLNRRFFTFHEHHRPYVILKWAESSDGFIDRNRSSEIATPLQISTAESRRLVHQWRSEEQAILVGTNTALLDNPRLTARESEGKNPLRIAIDRHNKIPLTYHLKDGSVPTLIFTESPTDSGGKWENVIIPFDTREAFIESLLMELYRRQITSLLVEGGAALLNSFLFSGKWDEARVFISPIEINQGIRAPEKPSFAYNHQRIDADELKIYRNEEDIYASQK
jgi:diaminohydroxyphosphoribosylaminopyrimidine deaminase/5-amino-6-(5-phosphoribosylamino)uracil reductase